ncbi:hypothetical protein CROQUDRAFT_176918 [Cronartium quercuum f. sp. fusiforme G11]|uniref:Uncharacterized protein n=1 Tax=Cronartium quercuum f. sp. fusiforme G11 TaxID=708437 RepID=A0A9P6NR98_9BASI|nr:hypothetical protein CROQUDRAFT_176918 [Cronartium quercuum f. sp. fusiforme G11]
MGSAVLQGAQLGATDLRVWLVGPCARPQISAECRVQTSENGMKNSTSMTNGLNSSEIDAELAHIFFTLAVANGQGQINYLNHFFSSVHLNWIFYILWFFFRFGLTYETSQSLCRCQLYLCTL